MDLRVVKEGKLSEDLLTKDRVKHIRGSSSSSISPSEREKTTSDLISLFNMRSSTPKQKPELHFNNQSMAVKATKPFSNRSPGISPVTSPVRAKHSLSHFRDEKPLSQVHKESPTHNVPRRKPKKSGDRPRLQNRPKSLVLTSQISLEEVVRNHCSQPHSDTEIDDDVKMEKLTLNQGPVAEEKPAKKSRQIAENVKEPITTSLIVRDIDIDDSVKSSDSKKSWLDNTVIFTEKPIETSKWTVSFLLYYTFLLVWYSFIRISSIRMPRKSGT